MSNNPPTTPPDRERSLSYVSDAQKTPTGPRTAGPLAGSSGKDKNVAGRFGPYHTPTPEQRQARSRTSSPKPRKRNPRSASADPIGTKEAEEEGDSDESEDIEIDESPLFISHPSEDDPIASNTTSAPTNVAQQDFLRLQTHIEAAIHTVREDGAFHEHLANIEGSGNSALGSSSLFPKNDVIGEREPSEIPHQFNVLEHATPIPPLVGDVSTAWFNILGDTINHLCQEQEKLRQLSIHSISQNNVLGAFQASVIKEIEKRLQNIEARLPGNLGHQDPPSTSSSQKEKLDTIARKLINIEQKIVAAPPKAGNPPGPQNKNPKTEGQGAKQKGAEAQANWYDKDLENFSTARLSLWAAAISTGKWGRRINDQSEPFNFKNVTERKETQAYIRRALQYYFGPGKPNQFPYAPPADLKVGSGWTKKFEWQIIDHDGNVLNSAKTPIYPPGRVNQPQFAPRSEDPTPPRETTKDKGKQRAVDTPVTESENPWIETPRGGSTSRDSSKPKQISFAAAAAATKPKITAPQQKYDNVPTTCFMTPMPKQSIKRTGNYGKRYMIKFHKDEKPNKGTEMPIQVVVSEINRTCSSLNVKANSAEWTPALNLTIFFTHDSVDSQIEKARNTILGAIARGCPRSIFIKSTKWSRIVIRDVPTQTWVSETNTTPDEDTGMIPGHFAKITPEELEHEVRKSHPILENIVFLEGPTWTNRDGIPDQEHGNVSFCVPDPEENYLRTLTRNPLILFHTPCFLTKWVEKIRLVQCDRCWKFGDKTHPNCPVRCRRCGGNHEEKEHNVACKKCEKSDINQEDRKNGRTTCSHPITCPNCNGEHYANDSLCKMRNFAACEERQRRKIGRGQTFISTYLEQQQSNAKMRVDDNLS